MAEINAIVNYPTTAFALVHERTYSDTSRVYRALTKVDGAYPTYMYNATTHNLYVIHAK
jgi:hypothetical protein